MPFKWLTFTNKNPNYLSIGHDVKMDKQLFENGFKFWDEIYNKYHWNPKSPEIVVEEPIKKVEDKPRDENKSGDKSTKKPAGESSEKPDVPDASEDKKSKTIPDQKPAEGEKPNKPNTVYVNDPMKSRERKENTAAQDSKETEQSSSKTNKIKTEL